MKKYLIGLALAVVGCQTQKPVTRIAFHEPIKPVKNEIREVALHTGKALDIKLDNFGGRYYNLVDSPDKSVVAFMFDKDRDPTLADSGYREQIHFEINTANPEVELSGRELGKANVIFSRWCFCDRRTVGNFMVNDGTLSIKKENGKLRARLKFKVPETTPIITELDVILE